MNHLLTQQCRPTAPPMATSLPDGSETQHAPWHSAKSTWQRAQSVDQIEHLWDFLEQQMEKPPGNTWYSKYLPPVSTSARHHQASQKSCVHAHQNKRLKTRIEENEQKHLKTRECQKLTPWTSSLIVKSETGGADVTSQRLTWPCGTSHWAGCGLSLSPAVCLCLSLFSFCTPTPIANNNDDYITV